MRALRALTVYRVLTDLGNPRSLRPHNAHSGSTGLSDRHGPQPQNGPPEPAWSQVMDLAFIFIFQRFLVTLQALCVYIMACWKQRPVFLRSEFCLQSS